MIKQINKAQSALKNLNIEKTIIIFLMLQPLFDMYMTIIGEKLDIFGFSIVTLIRMITILILTFMILKGQIKRDNKPIIYFGIYSFILIIYTIMHHFSINDYYIENNLYSFVTEALYLIRLVLPILFMYTIYKAKINKKYIRNTFMVISGTIAITIVLSNLFKISFIAYSLENQYIKDNILGWFTGAYEKFNHKLLTSRGWFTGANEIGSLLALLFPITIYNSIKTNKWYAHFITFIQMIAMIMIGSRIASLGWIIVYAIMILIYIFFVFIKKELKFNYKLCFLLILIYTFGIVLVQYSPVLKNTPTTKYESSYIQNIAKEEYIVNHKYLEEYIKGEIPYTDYIEKIKQKEVKVSESFDMEQLEKAVEAGNTEEIHNILISEYVLQNFTSHHIGNTYIKKTYPYYDDPDFWLQTFEMPLNIKGNGREMEKTIAKRLKERNDNYIQNTLFGMGDTPLKSRDFVIESDFIAHYYNLGIIGVIIFLIPYVALLSISGIIMLKNYKEKFTFENVTYAFAICLALGFGVLGGHVFDEYITSFIIVFILITLFKEVLNKVPTIAITNESIYINNKNTFKTRKKTKKINSKNL